MPKEWMIEALGEDHLLLQSGSVFAGAPAVVEERPAFSAGELPAHEPAAHQVRAGWPRAWRRVKAAALA